LPRLQFAQEPGPAGAESPRAGARPYSSRFHPSRRARRSSRQAGDQPPPAAHPAASCAGGRQHHRASDPRKSVRRHLFGALLVGRRRMIKIILVGFWACLTTLAAGYATTHVREFFARPSAVVTATTTTQD